MFDALGAKLLGPSVAWRAAPRQVLNFIIDPRGNQAKSGIDIYLLKV
jgi:hypothetical protein